MKAQVAFKKEAGPVGMSRQRGFTLVSTVLSFTIGGFIILGAWVAYRDMMAQMRVSNADRMMDQYAASVMQEITNQLSWSWRAEPIQTGSRNPRWNFMIRDVVNEYGSWYPYWERTQRGDSQVRYTPTQGVLIGNRQPKWVSDRGISYYLWSGQPPRRYETMTMDRRDKMTMESMLIDFERSQWEDAPDKGMVMLTITMQYRYRANAKIGLYSREYVRERTYRTGAYMRNWNSEVNEFNGGDALNDSTQSS